jgi:peptide/nickel transport system permease protein
MKQAKGCDTSKLSYIARRLLLASFVFFGVALITFILTRSISDNPIVAFLGKAASMHPEIAQAYVERFHLNEPVYIQFWYYLLGVLRGDLGYSWSRGAYVSQVITQTLPNTLQIVFFALLITLALGIPLGIVSCRYSNKPQDYGIRAFYLAGISSPPFFIALVLVLIFSYSLHLLPTGDVISLSVSKPQAITGFIILDSLLEGNFEAFMDALKHVLMPSMALALGNFGYVVRVLRSSLLEVMQTNYIRTARAKGLEERTVFLKHGLRNGSMPVVTLAALITTWMMGSAIFVENIFVYPGAGQYLMQALGSLDYAAILGITLVFTAIIVALNLVADILYSVLNPAIEL